MQAQRESKARVLLNNEAPREDRSVGGVERAEAVERAAGVDELADATGTDEKIGVETPDDLTQDQVSLPSAHEFVRYGDNAAGDGKATKGHVTSVGHVGDCFP
jgi:hypothetical protein